MNCKACTFYVAGDKSANPGFCYRYPPTVLPVQVQTMAGVQSGVQSFYPPVRDTQYCGEYRVKLSTIAA